MSYFPHTRETRGRSFTQNLKQKVPEIPFYHLRILLLFNNIK